MPQPIHTPPAQRTATPPSGPAGSLCGPLLRALLAAALFAGLLSVPNVSHADDAGAWTMITGTASLHHGKDTGLRLWFDTHARREPGRFVAIARPAIGYDLNRSLSVWFGASWVPVWRPAAPESTVVDLWQQVMWSGKVGPAPLLVRLRAEEQRHSAVDGISIRGRLFVRTAAKVRGPLQIALADEIFYTANETDWAGRGVNENRVFIGPALVADGWRAEFGYLHILRPMAQITVQHTAMAALFFAL